jgi:hypothetical protein
MIVDVTTRTNMKRSRHSVADYAMNPDNVPHWYSNISSVEWKTPRPLAIGSQIAFIAHFLGRRLAYTYEIVALDPGDRLIMRTSERPFPMETTYLFESTADGGTRMTLRNRGAPKGFSRIVAPFMSSAIRQANRKDLERLRKILEAPEAA